MSKERARPDRRNAVAEEGAVKSGTGCCGLTAFAEPLYCVRAANDTTGPLKRRFAYAPVCSGCKRLVGEVRLDNPMGDKEIIALQKAYNGTSWLMMIDSHHWPPFNFERGSAGILIPEGYKGQLRNQADLSAATTHEEDPRG